MRLPSPGLHAAHEGIQNDGRDEDDIYGHGGGST